MFSLDSPPPVIAGDEHGEGVAIGVVLLHAREEAPGYQDPRARLGPVAEQEPVVDDAAGEMVLLLLGVRSTMLGSLEIHPRIVDAEEERPDPAEPHPLACRVPYHVREEVHVREGSRVVLDSEAVVDHDHHEDVLRQQLVELLDQTLAGGILETSVLLEVRFHARLGIERAPAQLRQPDTHCIGQQQRHAMPGLSADRRRALVPRLHVVDQRLGRSTTSAQRAVSACCIARPYTDSTSPNRYSRSSVTLRL